MQNDRDEEKSPWEDFKPLREEPKEAGLLGRLGMLAFFCALGALGGGVFGFLLPVFLTPRRHRHDPWALDRALAAHADTETMRWIVGAVVGAAITAVWVLKLWRSARKG